MTTLADRSTRKILAPLAMAMLLGASVTAQAQSTDQRLQRVERLLDSSTLLEMARQNDQLRSEVQRLTGELQDAQRDIGDLRRQQRSLFEDIDTRLQDIEQGQAGNKAGGEATGSGAPGPVADLTDDLAGDLDAPLEQGPEAVAGLATETTLPLLPELTRDDTVVRQDAPPSAATDDQAEEAYRNAFELLRNGRYGAAGDGFRKVLAEHPDTAYANNARYWLGESYYVVRDFDAAMEHFQTVMNDPDNAKQPDAMLKAGYIQYEQGNYSDARQTLQQVQAAFPDTTVATLAENRLRRISEEGR